MNILFASTECFPFFKTGGLGDVVESLTQSLARLGSNVFLVLPEFDVIESQIDKKIKIGELYNKHLNKSVDILKCDTIENVNLILITNPIFKNKKDPYTDDDKNEWIDNFETFTLFSWACSRLCLDEKILNKKIDVVFSNEWQTGMIPAYINQHNKNAKDKISINHIIHNISFPGIFPSYHFHKLGLPQSYFNTEGIEYYSKISFQKAALFYADNLFTVSPTYAKEIVSSHQFGMGFEGLLNKRKKKLFGILNGVNYDRWSPEVDDFIDHKFSLTTIEDKTLNKKNILKDFRLSEKQILVGMVSRISEQKGFNIAIEYFERNTHRQNINFLIMGCGDKYLTQKLKTLSDKYENIRFIGKYKESLAHKIIASSDVFFMPSLFEPCGLTQLYSLRYGSIPVVNPTGGLKDTVVPFMSIKSKKANGFYLDNLSVDWIDRIFNKILILNNEKQIWRGLIENGMKANFSWDTSAKKYLSIIKKNKKS